MAISLTWPITSDGAGAVQYTANDWRTLLTNLFDEGVLGADSFEVTERALGTNMALDIAAGVAVIEGDDAAGQGNYLVEATESLSAVTIGTAHASNPRIDLVGIQLRDPSEGGSAGRDSIFSVVAGTAAASPSAPSTPDSFLTLAQVLVPASATAISDTDITDMRAPARLKHEVVNTASIDDGAVTTAKIPNSAATTAKIADGAVTTAKIAPGAVTLAERSVVQGCSLSRSTDQLAAGGGTTDVTYDSEDVDNGGYYPGSGSTVTVPTGFGGLHSISFAYELDKDANIEKIVVDISGTDHVFPAIDYGTGSAALIVPLSAADTIKCSIVNDGSNTDVSWAELHVYRIARTS
jgi:hypothetical protein